jgi:hypothetical protein
MINNLFKDIDLINARSPSVAFSIGARNIPAHTIAGG